MSHLARLSLANRALVALGTLAVLLLGVFAARALNQELLPSQSLPSVTIVAPYEGAAPAIVERDVAEPIEQQVQAGEQYQELTSESQPGAAVVQVAYDFGTDTDEVVRDLQQRLEQAQLPDEVDPSVQSGDVDDLPVVMLAATTPGDQRQLANRLQEQADAELESIEGVREASVSGLRDRVVRVTMNPDDLADEGLTTRQVTSALTANESRVPGGDVSGGGRTLSVEVGGAFGSVDEVENLPIPATGGGGTSPGGGAPGGSADGTGTAQGTPSGAAGAGGAPGQAGAAQSPQPVRLGDVATVEAADAERSSVTRTDSKPSLGVSVTKTEDGNTVAVSEAVRDELPEIEDQLAEGAELTMVFDQAPFIEDSIEGLTTEGLLGLAFAVLVILVFLLSVRSTLVTAISIPLSLLVALIALWGWGFSLNLLTLGGLTIAIGRVVDDSIVVLENIKRHLGYGEEKSTAVLNGVREVAGAVTASTLAAVAVFLPIVVVGGMVGELFRPFSLAVTIALLASLLVSLTIIPVLAYWFLKAPAGAAREPERIRKQAVAREWRSPLQRAYVPMIRWVSRHQVVTILLGVVVFAGSMALVPRLETSFLGNSQQNTFNLEQELPPGTSLSGTTEAAKDVEQALDEVPDVRSYQVTVGSMGSDFAAFFGVAGTNNARFAITTDPEADQSQVESELRSTLNDLDDVGELTLTNASEGQVGSELEVTVTAPDDGALRQAAGQVTDAVRDVSTVTDVTSNLTSEVPRISVDVDEEAAAERGLTEAQIGRAVQLVNQGRPAAAAMIDGERRDVELRLDGPNSTDPDEVANISIPTPAGTVRLGEVADVTTTQAPIRITHTDGERSATVSATPTTENIGAVTADVRERLADLELSEDADYALSGVSEEQQQAFRDLGIALGAAVLLVYLIMVATFRSLVQPLILLVSVPFAATGTVGLLLATDTPLGVSALIGALMLVGIVVTNAIVLLDLVNTYRASGMDARTAVVEGGRRRLRPVLMTAIATICALTPMALGLTGDGAFISRPLALTVIGGLTTSTLLTLLLVPALYVLTEDLSARVRARGADGPARAETAEEDSLLSLYRDLPDDASRTEFVHAMNGVANELADPPRGQRRLMPGSSDSSHSSNDE